MLGNIIKTAFRIFLRQKGYVFINILGLAIGITVFSMVMTYVTYEYSADKFHHNYENIYRIDLDSRFGVTPITLKQSIDDRFPEIISTRYFPRNAIIQWEEKKIESDILFVDPDFFGIFDYKVLRGDLQKAIREPAGAIVTRKWAEKMFDIEDPIGKVINYNRELNLEIMAIIEDPEQRSQLQVKEVIAPLHSLRNILDFENAWFSNYVTFLLLPEHDRSGIIRKQIEDFFIERHKEFGAESPVYFLRPFSELYFDSSKFDYCSHGSRSTVFTFLAAAFFIIIIACFNYINLSTARAGARAKEIGIRKALGASRNMLIGQMLCESVLLSLVSLILVWGFVRLLYPQFSTLFRINEVFFTPIRFLHLLGITLLIGIAAGVYPAFYHTALTPTQIFRGKTGKGNRGLLFRRILIILQFTISIAMIICTLTVFKQLKFLTTHDLGFDKDEIITFSQTTEIMDSKVAFKEEILKSPLIEAASYIYLPLGMIILSGWYIEKGDNEENKKKYRVVITEPEFLNVYGINLKSGRNFDPEISSDHNNVLVNEAFVKEHISGDPLQYTIWDSTQVIGIVDDFAYRPLQYNIEPMMMFWDTQETYAVALRIRPEQIDETIAYIESVFHKYSPEVAFEYKFQDAVFNEFYGKEKRFGKIFGYFAFLAVVISCLGMFGLASFMVDKRTREIGIRKVLGSDSTGIVILLNKEFTAMVTIAGILATPLTWCVMNNWLDSFGFHTTQSFWYYIIALAGALLVSWLAVSRQSMKAAMTNPAVALKYE